VAIATNVAADAFQDRFERALIVSVDSDLAPSIKCLREHFPKKAINAIAPHLVARRGTLMSRLWTPSRSPAGCEIRRRRIDLTKKPAASPSTTDTMCNSWRGGSLWNGLASGNYPRNCPKRLGVHRREHSYAAEARLAVHHQGAAPRPMRLCAHWTTYVCFSASTSKPCRRWCLRAC
jgi:hypothetical protein